jgi:hypothetical protein
MFFSVTKTLKFIECFRLFCRNCDNPVSAAA